MIIDTYKELFKADLEKLKAEINAYRDEAAMWLIEKGVSNSAGNLCLHLIGNLNCYIGAAIGNTGYVRDRPSEFFLKNIEKAALLKKLDDTIEVVAAALSNLTDDSMSEQYPVVIWDKPRDNTYTISYLLKHLNYHLGQVNYHRRLLDTTT